MADHSIMLSTEQEMALESLMTSFGATHTNGIITRETILTNIITTALEGPLREIYATLEQLRVVAAKLPESMRAHMVEGLTASQQTKLPHLLRTRVNTGDNDEEESQERGRRLRSHKES